MATILVCVLFCLQSLGTGYHVPGYRTYSAKGEYASSMQGAVWDRLGEQHDHLFIVAGIGSVWLGSMPYLMDLANFAADNGMTMSNFYFARRNEAPMWEELSKHVQELQDDTLYIYLAESNIQLQDESICLYYADGIYFYTLQELDLNLYPEVQLVPFSQVVSS